MVAYGELMIKKVSAHCCDIGIKDQGRLFEICLMARNTNSSFFLQWRLYRFDTMNAYSVYVTSKVCSYLAIYHCCIDGNEVSDHLYGIEVKGQGRI